MGRKARIVSDNVSYHSVEEIARMIESLIEVEGTIYRILSLSNKTMISERMGISRSGLYFKIRTRSLNLSELGEIFKMIMSVQEEDSNNKAIRTLMKYKGMTIEEFNEMNDEKRRRLKRRRKRNGKKTVGGDERPVGMAGGDGD